MRLLGPYTAQVHAEALALLADMTSPSASVIFPPGYYARQFLRDAEREIVHRGRGCYRVPRLAPSLAATVLAAEAYLSRGAPCA